MKDKSEICRSIMTILQEEMLEDSDEDMALYEKVIKYEMKMKETISFSPAIEALYIKTKDITTEYYEKNNMTISVESFKLGFRLCLEIMQSMDS